MKESRQEHQRKGKVNQSINGKQKDSAQKETLVVPPHDENKRGTSKHPSSLAAEPQTKEKRWGKFIERKVSQRPVSVWEEKSKTVKPGLRPVRARGSASVEYSYTSMSHKYFNSFSRAFFDLMWVQWSALDIVFRFPLLLKFFVRIHRKNIQLRQKWAMLRLVLRRGETQVPL